MLGLFVLSYFGCVVVVSSMLCCVLNVVLCFLFCNLFCCVGLRYLVLCSIFYVVFGCVVLCRAVLCCVLYRCDKFCCAVLRGLLVSRAVLCLVGL